MMDPNFQKAYQRYAKFYNWYFGKIMNPGRLKAIEFADLKEGERVLEVGVGTGLSLPFYPSGVKVSGIDLSEKMLLIAKKVKEQENLSNVESLEIMNAEAMTFADNSFDCVMAMHVSTVVGNPQNFANEMRRVCRPGGRIVMINYFHDPKSIVGKFSGVIAPYASMIGFRHDLTLEDFLRKTKFNIERSIPVNLFNIHNVFLVKNEK